MIAYQDGRCAGCQNCATRELVDEDGERLPLCDRCPSPEEIRRRTAEVRSHWDEVDYWCRRHGLPRKVGLAAQLVNVTLVATVPPGLPVRRGRPAVPTEV